MAMFSNSKLRARAPKQGVGKMIRPIDLTPLNPKSTFDLLSIFSFAPHVFLPRDPYALNYLTILSKTAGRKGRVSPNLAPLKRGSGDNGDSDGGWNRRFMAALHIVLQERTRGCWLESVLELQRSSLEVCKDCRELVPFHVRVTDATPGYLWNTREKMKPRGDGDVPPIRVTRIAWVRGDPEKPFSLPPDLEEISYGPEVKSPLRGVAWPQGVKRILLSANWMPPTDDVGGCDWPPSLEELKIGELDRNLDTWVFCRGSYLRCQMALSASPLTVPPAALPRTLRYIAFGNDFHYSVEGVTWPEGLKGISFGNYFNGAIDGMRFPRGLEDISFGNRFNQSVERFEWPPALKKVSLGDDFDQPLTAALFPPGLEELLLGMSFDQPIEHVLWPEGLKRLVFGTRFDQSILNASFPSGLRELVFGLSFNKPIESIVWPKHLKCLVFGGRFDQSFSHLPSALEQLSFGYSFNQPVTCVRWPKTLQQLKFGHDFDQHIEGISWPASLRCLVLGYCFNQSIDRVAWPIALEQLTFGGCFNHSIEDTLWPDSLRRMTFGYAFIQSIERVRWPARLAFLSLDTSWQASRSSLPKGVKIELT